VVVATEPGDVVTFHAHLMTCAQGGTPRLSWTIDYLPWPGLGRLELLGVLAAPRVRRRQPSPAMFARLSWRAWMSGSPQGRTRLQRATVSRSRAIAYPTRPVA
jgi:hypothetical protein